MGHPTMQENDTAKLTPTAKAEDAPEKHPTDYCNIVHNFPFL